MARTADLNPRQTGEQLGVSVHTLKAWRQRTRNTGVQIGPRWFTVHDGPKAGVRYYQGDIDRWRDARREVAS